MSTINSEKPKGILIAIGGAIDAGTPADNDNAENISSTFMEIGILKRMLEELKGTTNRIEIITTASKIPEETGQHYVDAFLRLENQNVGVINIKTKEETKETAYIERIKQAEGVLMTGGDQSRLTGILGESEIMRILHERYINEHFVLAGTCAGAMAMSAILIMGGNSHEALLKGAIQLAEGLSFIKDVTFDSHFIKRGRIGRLCQTIAANPSILGIGLGEDTGLLITKGDHMEAIGSGLVMFVEGDEIRYTNIEEIENGEPISIENLTVHVLSKGHNYLLSERKMI
jgi:cyanophycinase